MKARYAALISAVVTVAVILVVTKLVIVYADALNGSALIPGFLDFAIAYNRGISFGLFTQDTVFGDRVLVSATVIIIAVLCIWAYKTPHYPIATSLGIIVGGALVNTADRALNGAVFDFLYVKLGSIPLFVCNAPDIAISFGVIVLVLVDFYPIGRQR
ncbi:MAG TPA: signal peptidase II [Rhizomicrobium sp.]|nr:signal peptidase II [Rhizomicrobium sp.]